MRFISCRRTNYVCILAGAAAAARRRRRRRRHRLMRPMSARARTIRLSAVRNVWLYTDVASHNLDSMLACWGLTHNVRLYRTILIIRWHRLQAWTRAAQHRRQHSKPLTLADSARLHKEDTAKSMSHCRVRSSCVCVCFFLFVRICCYCICSMRPVLCGVRDIYVICLLCSICVCVCISVVYLAAYFCPIGFSSVII